MTSKAPRQEVAMPTPSAAGAGAGADAGAVVGAGAAASAAFGAGAAASAAFGAADPADTHAEPVVRALGRTDYATTWQAMQAFSDVRDAATRDELWLTEHPPIYTLGLAGRREHLLRDNGITTLKVDRGGQVTYHGPGQLVAYTLVDLRRARLSIRDVVRSLEAGVVEWLDSVGISAYGKPAAPGVYVEVDGVEAKLAALGLKVRRGCTYHGVAVNVAMDLAPFADIDPCGFPGLAVTQLSDLGVLRTVEAAGLELAPFLARRMHGLPR